MSTGRLPSRPSRRGCVMALACLVLVGCGRRGGPPGTIAVTGTITHAGRSLPDGSVHFSPASGPGGGGAGRIAAGRYLVHLAQPPAKNQL